MGKQNFAGLRGRNSVGKRYDVTKRDDSTWFKNNVRGQVNSCVRVTRRNPQTSIPQKY